MVERSFDFHEVPFSVASSIPGVTEAIELRLRRYALNGASKSAFSYRYSTVESARAHVVARPRGQSTSIYDPQSGEASYFRDADSLFVQHGDGIRLLCDLGAGTVEVSVAASAVDLWILSRPMFTLPWLELLKRHGLYGVHAACVAHDGEGVLIAGSSGAGKTTLALALVRGGFGFLADDTVFLRRNRSGPEVLAFPDEIGVADRTMELLPELRGVEPGMPELGSPKRQLAIERIYGDVVVDSCAPKLILFPRARHKGRTRIEELSSGVALAELSPNVFPTAPVHSQAHLDALRELVESTRCLDVSTGDDLGSVPERVRSLLQ